MVAVAHSEPVEPFGRYRFRGLDPKSVELWATNFEQENAHLRAEVAALEVRAAKADAFAEDAVREMVALQETVRHAETDQEIFAARQRMFREEAAQIVHDAWAEANVVRTQTQHLRERTQAQLTAAKDAHAHHLDAMRGKMMEEVAATIDQMRAAMAAECEEHQSRIATLESERARIVIAIELATANALTAIAPLQSSAAPTDDGTIALPHAMQDAAETLTLLVTAMGQSLRTPAADWEEQAATGD